MWNVEVATDEAKSGLAPVRRAIDRRAPYKRKLPQ
jgi:hypothetical protein